MPLFRVNVVDRGAERSWLAEYADADQARADLAADGYEVMAVTQIDGENPETVDSLHRDHLERTLRPGERWPNFRHWGGAEGSGGLQHGGGGHGGGTDTDTGGADGGAGGGGDSNG